MKTKHVLLLGDKEKEMFDLFHKNNLVEAAVNFSQSPSVGVLVELPSRDAQTLSEQARKLGMKAGVYATHDKGVLWLHKAINLTGGKNG